MSDAVNWLILPENLVIERSFTSFITMIMLAKTFLAEILAL